MTSHKDLFPMDGNDALGLSLGALGLIIAAGGGIGGGGMLVPLFILVMGFEPKYAIPLSNAAIFGSAIVNTCFNIRERHPRADRPLVDWDLILAMEPLTIFGAVVGAYVNKVLPEFILVSCLVILLTATAYRTLKKAIKLWRKESAISRLEREIELNGLLGTEFVSSSDTAKVESLQGKKSDVVIQVDDDSAKPFKGVSSSGSDSESARCSPSSVFDQTSMVSSSHKTLTKKNSACSNGNSDVPVAEETSSPIPSLETDSGCCRGFFDGDDVPPPPPPEAKAKATPMPDSTAEGGADLNFPSGGDIPSSPGVWTRGGQPMHEARRGPGEILTRILREERRTVPWPKLLVLLLLFAGVLSITILKGGGLVASPIGIVCGTWPFWLLSALSLPWVLIFSAIVRCYLLRLHKIKAYVGYPYQEGDIQWTPRATVVYPAICSGAGLCAGLFGIGGGIVKGPLMLELGVLPQVASATSACMILYTAASACSMFYVFGLLKVDYAVCAFILGITSSFVGQLIMVGIMRKTKRTSLIVFSIGGVVALSAIFMSIEGVKQIEDTGILGGHHHLCSIDGT